MKGKNLIASFVLVCLCCTGCSHAFSVVVESGQEEILRIGDSVITRSEMNIVRLEYERMYTDNYSTAFGTDFWQVDTGDGVLLEDYVKENVLWTELVELAALCQVAEQDEMILTEQQMQNAEQAGKEYYSKLSSELISELCITQESSISLMEKYALARLVTDKYCQEAKIEVSENEARVILIQQLKLDTLEEAEDIYQEISEQGGSWENLTANKDMELVQTARGDYLEEIEQVLFSLETGEVSEPMYLSGSYYLFYCVDDHLVGESEQNKSLLIEQHNYEAWSAQTIQVFETQDVYLNTVFWNEVEFVYREDIDMPSFQECFKTYLSED